MFQVIHGGTSYYTDSNNGYVSNIIHSNIMFLFYHFIWFIIVFLFVFMISFILLFWLVSSYVRRANRAMNSH